MTSARGRPATWASLIALLSLLAACGFGRARPVQFFVLAPLTETPAAIPERSDAPLLVVGPIEMPPYTARPQFLTRKNEYELKLAESARWAEPLADNFTRVLVEDLSLLLGPGNVTTLLAGSSAQASHQVVVEVTEFIATDAGEARLIAYWRILGDGGRAILKRGKAQHTAPAAGTDYPSLVAALGQTVAALSRDIAAASAALPAPTVH